jgi:hypothetical protein
MRSLLGTSSTTHRIMVLMFSTSWTLTMLSFQGRYFPLARR